MKTCKTCRNFRSDIDVEPCLSCDNEFINPSNWVPTIDTGYLTATIDQLQAEIQRMADLCYPESEVKEAFKVGMLNSMGICQAEFKKYLDEHL